MNKKNQYTNMLLDLKNRLITPSDVVGTGYRNPRKVAFEWIYTQIINADLELRESVSDVYASSTGMPFTTIEKAKASKVFKALENDEFKTISGLPVVSFGIRGGINEEGYLVWIKVGKKAMSKVA